MAEDCPQLGTENTKRYDNQVWPSADAIKRLERHWTVRASLCPCKTDKTQSLWTGMFKVGKRPTIYRSGSKGKSCAAKSLLPVPVRDELPKQ